MIVNSFRFFILVLGLIVFTTSNFVPSYASHGGGPSGGGCSGVALLPHWVLMNKGGLLSTKD